MANHYDLLGVNRNASEPEIKKAYRKKVLECHPDKTKNDPELQKKFINLTEAYQTLSDPKKRVQYNYALDHPSEQVASIEESTEQSTEESELGLFDLLREMFDFTDLFNNAKKIYDEMMGEDDEKIPTPPQSKKDDYIDIEIDLDSDEVPSSTNVTRALVLVEPLAATAKKRDPEVSVPVMPADREQPRQRTSVTAKSAVEPEHENEDDNKPSVEPIPHMDIARTKPKSSVEPDPKKQDDKHDLRKPRVDAAKKVQQQASASVKSTREPAREKPTIHQRRQVSDVRAKVEQVRNTMMPTVEQVRDRMNPADERVHHRADVPVKTAKKRKQPVSKREHPIIAEIQDVIAKLQKEFNARWPYPNKARKQTKIDGLTVLIGKIQSNVPFAQAVSEVVQAYPEIRAGRISHRTADLLDRVANLAVTTAPRNF